MGIESSITNISGIDTEIRAGGEGRPLVYLHGALGLRFHENFLDELSRSFRVIAPAHPGFERTDWPREIRDVGDLAYFHLDLVEHFGLEDAILVGSCLGGWIAAEMMIRQSAPFRRLVLVNALGVKFGDHLTRDIADIHALPQDEANRLLFHAPERAGTDLSDLSDDELAAIARAREAFTYFGWKPYMHNPSLKRWLHRIKLPTLVAWGASDGFVTTSYGQKLASALPDARFEAIAEAGHFPMIERPLDLAQLIAGFNESRGATAAA